MGCLQSKVDAVVVRTDQTRVPQHGMMTTTGGGLHRDTAPVISHLNQTKSYTYTFNPPEDLPPNYSLPQITVTEPYTMGSSSTSHEQQEEQAQQNSHPHHLIQQYQQHQPPNVVY